uniref:ZAD domain-containing protein n=1 Tax=Anopheles culicifacies TaxID=139723 RepID=A0A182LXX5_9DIPT
MTGRVPFGKDVPPPLVPLPSCHARVKQLQARLFNGVPLLSSFIANCRLCLGSNFGEKSTTIIEERFSTMLKHVFPFPITNQIGLPMNVCADCYKSIHIFYAYSHQVQANQLKLQETLGKAEYLDYTEVFKAVRERGQYPDALDAEQEESGLPETKPAIGKESQENAEDVIFIDTDVQCKTEADEYDQGMDASLQQPHYDGTTLRSEAKARTVCTREIPKKLFILDVVELSESNLARLKEYSRDAQILCKTCDISNREELKQMLERDVLTALGSIDIVVNSAGIVESDVPDKLIGVNLTGVINSCLIALNIMSRENGGKGGVIVNVASTAGLEPIPFLPTYCASKHGLIGFTRSLGVQPVFDETGVKFIIICPGGTRTRMFENVRSLSIEIKALQQMFREFKHPFAPQSPDVVGDCVVQAIVKGENGSTWICNDGKISIHAYPPTQYM